MTKFPLSYLLALVCITLLISCNTDDTSNSGYSDIYQLPSPPFNYIQELPSTVSPYVASFNNSPEDNPLTNEGATLGRVLFYDKNLSANGTISCASCHIQEFGFSDPAIKSVGLEGETTRRNSMGLINTAFYKPNQFFWDHRAQSLEEQVLMPIEDPVEMGMELDDLPQKLTELSYYDPLFNDAFGSSTITKEGISKALSQFVRSMYSFSSKYDEGIEITQNIFEDFPNFTAEENLGKAIFNGKETPEVNASCAICHMPNATPLHFSKPIPEGANQVVFGGAETNNIGLDDNVNVPDNGEGEILDNPSLFGHFKASSLRNIEVTGPYMHDGRLQTLEEVVEHYSTGVKNHPTLSAHMKDHEGEPRHLNLTTEEKQALVAFLKTLTDHQFLTSERFSNPFVNQ